MASGDPALPTQQARWSVDELIPFGKYVLLNKISSGATAAVYKAKIKGEAGFERVLTIKRILPQMAGDPEFVETFVAEAKICARLNHSSICPIYELGKVGESLYMASEWLAGKDLGAMIRRLQYTGRVMPPLVAAWIGSRLCDALDYAHSMKDVAGKPIGIVHQDLSPANIVISYEGQVKLIDFGLAKATGRAQQTNVDALKQKIGYMSPELVRGHPLDARSDLFSVGVCLYEMLTGRRLFAGADDIATLKMVSSAVVAPPSALLEDTPDDLELIVMRALERDPNQRWPSAAEMGQALMACIVSDDPTFDTRNVAELMKDLFSQDMAAEQRRQNDLLAASQDAVLMEQRRRFFASPLGAAAIAKAEAARRAASTRPPPAAKPKQPLAAAPDSEPDLRALVAAAPRAAPPPPPRVPASIAASPRQPPPPAPTRRNAPPLVSPAATQPSRPSSPEISDDELTTYQAEEIVSSPAAEFTAAQHAQQAEKAQQAALADHPTPAAPIAIPRPPKPAGVVAAAVTDDDAMPAPATAEEISTFPPARQFDEEPTGFFEPGLALAPTAALREGPFEEEATQIFFSQEEGIGIPDVPDDELTTVAPPEPLKLPVPAEQRAAMSGDPSQRKTSKGNATTTGRLAPLPWPASNDTGQFAPSAAQTGGFPAAAISDKPDSTLEFLSEPPGGGRRSELAWVIAGLIVIIGLGIVYKTPLGVTLGMRAAPEGVIEVRTVPPTTAAVKLDGIYRGHSPLRLEGVRAGNRVLDLEADGFAPVTRRIELEGGDTMKMDVLLEARAAP